MLDGHRNEGWIRDGGLGGVEREAQRLDHQVPAIDAARLKPLEDIERDQRRDTLSVGRALPDADIVEFGTDRRFPRGRVRREIRHGHGTASRVQHVDDALADRASAVRVATMLGHRAEGPRQAWVAECLAGAGRAAVDGQLAGRQVRQAGAPEVRRDRLDLEPFLCEPDGGRQNVRHAPGAVAFDQIEPAGTRAGNRHRVRVDSDSPDTRSSDSAAGARPDAFSAVMAPFE